MRKLIAVNFTKKKQKTKKQSLLCAILRKKVFKYNTQRKEKNLWKKSENLKKIIEIKQEWFGKITILGMLLSILCMTFKI